ncbi:MAG: hypothetical protein ACTHMT_15525 [Verrucomicrobiota bacterium]
MAISTGPIIHVLGFERECSEASRVEDYNKTGVSFSNFEDWNSVPRQIAGSLTDLFENSKTGVELMLSWGWRLWLGCRAGKLAIVSWTRSHKLSSDFFFPLSKNEVLIWYTETLAEHRGLGLLPLMLDYIVQTLASEGTHKAYVTCAAYNESSRRGIEKAHFKLIGHGIMRAGTGRGLVWLQRHSENCIKSSR